MHEWADWLAGWICVVMVFALAAFLIALILGLFFFVLEWLINDDD